MEHVAGGKDGLAVGTHLHIGAQDIAVAADNLFSLGVPHDELFVAVVHRVKFVQVVGLACSSASLSECDFPQSSNLQQDIGRIVGINDINLVVTLVGHSELAFRCQFFFEQFLGNRLNDFLYHFFSF